MGRTLEGVRCFAEKIVTYVNAADTVHPGQENLGAWSSEVEIERLAPQEYELRPLPEGVRPLQLRTVLEQLWRNVTVFLKDVLEGGIPWRRRDCKERDVPRSAVRCLEVPALDEPGYAGLLRDTEADPARDGDGGVLPEVQEAARVDGEGEIRYLSMSLVFAQLALAPIRDVRHSCFVNAVQSEIRLGFSWADDNTAGVGEVNVVFWCEPSVE